MNYKIMSIDNYQVLVNDGRGFMSLITINKLLKVSDDKIKKDLDGRVNDENKNTERLIYLDELYYSLDIIVITAFDYDYKAAFYLYEEALKKQIVFNDYVKKIMSEEKTAFKKLNAIVTTNKDLINSFIKYENTERVDDKYGNIGYISTESLQILIGLLRDKNAFDYNFGVIRDYAMLFDILYFTNSVWFNDKEKEVEFGNGDDVSYIAITMYNIIKMKPFISGNEIIAAFIAYYYLEQSKLIAEENFKFSSANDITLACGLIINSTDDNIIDTLKMVKTLLAKHYDVADLQTTYQLRPIVDTTEEGIMNYIISSIEEFYGYQGYYDYFKGDSYVYKLHYHGRYDSFSLNKAKTFIAEKTLFFNATLCCFSEAPLNLLNREAFIKDIVEEIKVRSYNDVIIPFLKKLEKKVKPYFALNSISIEFDFAIKTLFDEDYDC